MVIDFLGDLRRSTLVVGTGRSGTTWIGAVISSMTHSRQIFEPFILDENEELALSSSSASTRAGCSDIAFYISIRVQARHRITSRRSREFCAEKSGADGPIAMSRPASISCA